MNAADARGHHAQIGARHNNGINAFLEVRSPLTLRCLRAREALTPKNK